VKRLVIVGVGGLVVAAAWCAFAQCRFGRHLEWRFYDQYMRSRPARPWSTPAGRIRIIAIDDESIRFLGPWSWPRIQHARLLQVLSHPAYRPKAIGYDVSFLQPKADQAQGDAALVRMVRQHGGVCLGYHFEGGDARSAARAASGPAVPAALDRMRLRCRGGRYAPATVEPWLPWPALAEAGWLGAMNAEPDDDRVLRRLPVVVRYRGCAVPSLSLATVLRAVGCEPGDVEVVPGRSVRFAPPGGSRVTIPIDRDDSALVNFPGPSATADVTSFVDVLRWGIQVQQDGNDTAARALAAFKDTITFVGMYYSLVPDVVATPVDEVYPGVGVHAALAQGLLSGAHLCDCPAWIDIALVALVSLAAGGLATWPRARWGVPAFVVLLGGTVGAGFGAFTIGRVLSTAAPLMAGVTSFTALMVFRQLVTERRRRRVRRLFGQYLSPEAVSEIVEQADHLALSGRRMVAVVLFSDIRGFTALTERLGAHAIVEILNEYLDAMTEVIQRHGGAVNKFVGDEIFATFGVPVPHPDDALRAVRAGIEMQQRLAAMRRDWHEQDRPELRMGVGISRGEVVAGTIGSERRKDYTAIGDAVNLGARLEGLTKDLRERVLVCESIWEAVQGRVSGRPLGEVSIRGRSTPIRIFAIDVPD